jgi:hypothetical protein
MVEFIRAYFPNATISQLLLITFGVYLALIGAFSVIYLRLFGMRHDHFLFQADIQKAQLKAAMSRTAVAIARTQVDIQCLTEVLSAVEAGTAGLGSAVLPSGRKFTTYDYALHTPTGQEYEDRLQLDVLEPDGKLVSRVDGSMDEPLSIASFGRWLSAMISSSQRDLTHHQNYANEISVTPAKSFGGVDFLYFSTITQTTVGYGDILPNSTLVRLLVMAQILLGYVVLVILLNLILVGASSGSESALALPTLLSERRSCAA